MYVLCMMLYIILNNAIHRGRTKMEIKKVRKIKVQVFRASRVTFILHLKSMQLVNNSVQNVFCRVSVQPCYL